DQFEIPLTASQSACSRSPRYLVQAAPHAVTCCLRVYLRFLRARAKAIAAHFSADRIGPSARSFRHVLSFQAQQMPFYPKSVRLSIDIFSSRSNASVLLAKENVGLSI